MYVKDTNIPDIDMEKFVQLKARIKLAEQEVQKMMEKLNKPKVQAISKTKEKEEEKNFP
jgi:hypothetical protein